MVGRRQQSLKPDGEHFVASSVVVALGGSFHYAWL
jgi:hypothetical protein